MNAYELSDCLEALCRESKGSFTKDAANMLRQQADRIANLEKDLAVKTRDRDVFSNFTLAYEKRIAELEKQLQDGIQSFGIMQDEMLKEKFTFPRWSKEKEMFDSWANHETSQTKPLSDEEIHYAVKRWEMKYNYKHDADVHESLHEFARAIEERHGIK